MGVCKEETRDGAMSRVQALQNVARECFCRESRPCKMLRANVAREHFAGPGLATADDCDDGEEVSRVRLRYPRHLMSGCDIQSSGDFFFITIFFTLLNCSCQFLYNSVFKLIRLRSKE